MKTIWIDIETTGINEFENEIIELAAVYISEGGSVKRFHMYGRPSKPLTDIVKEITGLTDLFLKKNGIGFYDLHLNFLAFLKSIIDPFDRNDKAIFAGFKTDFDAKFIRQLFLKNNDNYFGSYFYSANLDVSSLIADAISRGVMPPLSNYKLETCCNYFGIGFEAHKAIEDINATIQLCEAVRKLK